MNTELMFSKASDNWSTPQDFWDVLNAEFVFQLDAAASRENRKCDLYFGHDAGEPYTDALVLEWNVGYPPWAVWLNPPYSKCREFIAKAAAEAAKGCTVVCLVPARVDTKWFVHAVENADEIRFIIGRLRFGGSKDSAPFPSAVIIFRPVLQSAGPRVGWWDCRRGRLYPHQTRQGNGTVETPIDTLRAPAAGHDG